MAKMLFFRIICEVIAGMLIFAGSALGETGESGMAMAMDSLPVSPHYPAALRGGALPDMEDEAFVSDFTAWWDAQRAWLNAQTDHRDALDGLFRACLPAFLAGDGAANPMVSPVSLALTLVTLRERTRENGSREISAALGYDPLDAPSTGPSLCDTLRWDDGDTACVPGASLWLNADVTIDANAAQTLAGTAHTSVYRGDLTSADGELAAWVSAWTNGLDDGEGLSLGEGARMAIFTSLRLSGRWLSPFREADTVEGVFHAPNGDVRARFMRSEAEGVLYTGARFTGMVEGMGEMGEILFLLPAEGVDVREMLTDAEALAFLQAGSDWEAREYVRVSAAVPKLTLNGRVDGRAALENLGVTAIFDPQRADFTPGLNPVVPVRDDAAEVIAEITPDSGEALWLDALWQVLPLSLSEWGVNVSPLELSEVEGLEPMNVGLIAPSGNTAEFNLNRPFMWAILGRDRLPMLVGVVNRM